MTEAGLFNYKKQLAELEAFMATGAYASRQATLRQDIADREASILQRPPVNAEEVSAVLLLYGERAQLLTDLSFFEDSCATLKNQILEAEDEATQSTETK